MDLILKRVRNVKLPQYSSEGAAALDFYIPDDMDWETKTLAPGESVLVPTGICVQLPNNTAMICCNKSSRGVIGLVVGAHLIDEDYRGQVNMDVHNISRNPVTIRRSEKLIQMLIIPYIKVTIYESNKLTTTKRGTGGFGSTGHS